MKVYRRTTTGFAFVIPGIVVFLLFKYMPMLQAFKMNLYDRNIINPPASSWG